jgi:hypothetical protein
LFNFIVRDSKSSLEGKVHIGTKHGKECGRLEVKKLAPTLLGRGREERDGGGGGGREREREEKRRA